MLMICPSLLEQHGKEIEYDLGVFLGGRYPMLLKTKNIQLQSSHSPRVIASGKFVAVGMLPKTKDQQFSEDIIDKYEPLTPKIIQIDDDYTIYPFGKKCAEYEEQQKIYEKSPAYKNLTAKHKKTMEDVEKYCGKDIKNFSDAMDIFDTLKTELYQDKE